MRVHKRKIDFIESVKSSITTIFIGTLLLMIAHTADAQNRWSVELRPGANFTTKNLGDANLKNGFGFEGAFAYRFIPQLAAYAGWSWNKFSADKSFAGSNVDFEETGYCFGLQFMHPIENSCIRYMIKGGGTYNHIETENRNGEIINDTGHGLGWQLGAGVAIPIGNRFSFIPEVRYRSLSRNIKIGDGSRSVDLNYISASAGLAFSF
ncbi:MAG: outer membrane protein [Chitinophagaceae bacterium]